ncbi:MAG: hypothetical protein Q8R38_03520 [Candidatus Omnitrophota bacterium]|nr:hypothetical protein [Candidatus Omnitrophota bacterium]
MRHIVTGLVALLIILLIFIDAYIFIDSQMLKKAIEAKSKELIHKVNEDQKLIKERIERIHKEDMAVFFERYKELEKEKNRRREMEKILSDKKVK